MCGKAKSAKSSKMSSRTRVRAPSGANVSRNVRPSKNDLMVQALLQAGANAESSDPAKRAKPQVRLQNGNLSVRKAGQNTNWTTSSTAVHDVMNWLDNHGGVGGGPGSGHPSRELEGWKHLEAHTGRTPKVKGAGAKGTGSPLMQKLAQSANAVGRAMARRNSAKDGGFSQEQESQGLGPPPVTRGLARGGGSRRRGGGSRGRGGS